MQRIISVRFNIREQSTELVLGPQRGNNSYLSGVSVAFYAHLQKKNICFLLKIDFAWKNNKFYE